MIWLTILAMAAVVFGSRYLFLEPRLPVRLSKNTLAFLSYSAPAVLTAIFAPIVFIRENQLDLSLDNSYLICAILAAFLAYTTRSVLLTTVLSMGLFFVIH
ncbi:AzlD domain-containing protein [Shewanella psychropiezotolerans]|uniref:AzlD domain-containing protein n=1 Tax=Shewanella psychropiezotolerans TaxID=2593655 RepID=A0ABX5X0X7_9GAMM|nr:MULTISPECIES: AzlD domain-containing protein [Shewanella]MPY21387.1 AzlD domain-containing protein [Shewanella sp. YLB-07]MPY22174.1 AzlD domain-containing protein [Shewanella sp. YLB-07]QDO84974.1 AzlD domain-containing protein [Shewanella psychropiezotolerans]